MITLSTAVIVFSILLIISWVRWCILSVRRDDERLHHFNEVDWKIDLLAKPTYIIRFVNAVGCGCGPSCFTSILLRILDYLVVQPALSKSLELMYEAEQSGIVPDILCNEQARSDMKERLDELLADIMASQTMSSFSKILNYTASQVCLTNHYSLLKMAMNEKVAEEVVTEPVFIVSLPRTGTTILHRTMALDRARFRNFDQCDLVISPTKPIPRWDEKGRKQLAEKSMEMFEQFQTLFPGWLECLETMHGFRPGEAEEDLGWYNAGIGHLYMDVLMKLYPENRKKTSGMFSIESEELAKYRYAWLELVMKIYQYTDKDEWNKRNNSMRQEDNGVEQAPLKSYDSFTQACPTEHLPWLMKDPNHSAYLPQLVEQFPDAKFIFTHRSPKEIVPSMAKLFVCFTSVEHIPGAPGTHSKEWGQETVTRMHHYLDGMVSFTNEQGIKSPLGFSPVKPPKTTLVGNRRLRAKGESDRRIDFYFKDLVKDIPASISIIYQTFYPDQPSPSKEAKEAFRAYLDENEREKRGNQRRSLEDFHLIPEDVKFTEYNELFLKNVV